MRHRIWKIIRWPFVWEYAGTTDTRLWVEAAGWVLGVAAALVLIIAPFAYGYDRIQVTGCRHSGHRLELPASYDFWADECFVTLPNGKVIPLDAYRANDDGRRNP